MKLLPVVKKQKTEKHEHEKPLILSAYRDKLYLVFILLTTLFASCFFQLFTLQTVFFKSEWHLSEQFIGGLMAMNGLIIVGTEMVIVSNLEGRKPPLFLIGTGIIIAAISYTILNLMPAAAWVALISIILITIGEMLSMPFMNTFWISRSEESNRGEYAGLYTIAWSVAQIIGPIYGAFLIDYGGYSLFWWVITGICLLTSVGFFTINNLNKIREWRKSQYVSAS
jgi:predicted MFS family arabinose efflux permease